MLQAKSSPAKKRFPDLANSKCVPTYFKVSLDPKVYSILIISIVNRKWPINWKILNENSHRV